MQKTILSVLAVVVLAFGAFYFSQPTEEEHDHCDPGQHAPGEDHSEHCEKNSHDRHEMHFDSMTRAELAEHATTDDCYVGYKRAIYTITDIIAGDERATAVLGPTCGTVEEFTQTYEADMDVMSFKEFME